jgi:hypothetical protein
MALHIADSQAGPGKRDRPSEKISRSAQFCEIIDREMMKLRSRFKLSPQLGIKPTPQRLQGR